MSNDWGTPHNIPGAPPLTAETVALLQRHVAIKGKNTLTFSQRGHERGFVGTDGQPLPDKTVWSAGRDDDFIDSDHRRIYGKIQSAAATDFNGFLNSRKNEAAYQKGVDAFQRVCRKLAKFGLTLHPTFHANQHPLTGSYLSLDMAIAKNAKKGTKALIPADPSDMEVRHCLPGGKYHDLYTAKLNRMAHCLNGAVDENGVKIPIILRLLHECNGSHFWWGYGKPNDRFCSPDQFIELFRYTHHYLRVEKGVNNILIEWNTNWKGQGEAGSKRGAEYALSAYPGDDWVDFVTFDQYKNEVLSTLNFFTTMIQFAEDHKKLTACSEICCAIGGFHRPDRPGEKALRDTWHEQWAKMFENPLIQQLVWFGFWTNSNTLDHYISPFEPYRTNYQKYFLDNPRFIYEGDDW